MENIIFSPCFLIKGKKFCEISDMKITKTLNNYFIITKYGSMIHPDIVSSKIVDNIIVYKNESLGDFFDLVDFIKDSESEYIFLQGFSRAVIQKIFGLVILESNGRRKIRKQWF